MPNGPDSTRQPGEPVADCPKLPNLLVQVFEWTKTDGLAGIEVNVTPAGGKKTTKIEGVEYKDLQPGAYDVTIDLGKLKNSYGIMDADSQNETLEEGVDGCCVFWIEKLAWPKIRLIRDDDGKPVAKVGVKLSGPQDQDIGATKGNGIAEVPSGQKGIKPGDYTVTFTFSGPDTENYQVVDLRTITVPAGCTDTFPFTVKESWVKFKVEDDLQKAIAGLDYVLTFPDGSKKKQGTLGGSGLVHEKGPPGKYVFSLKILSQAAWRDPDLALDKATTMKVSTGGFPDDTEVTFEVFDALGLNRAALATVKGKAKAGTAESDPWTPSANALEKLTGSSVVFVAKAGTMQAVSPPAVITKKQALEIKGTWAPKDTTVTFHYYDGEPVAAPTANGKVEVAIPIGQKISWIEIADRDGAHTVWQDDQNRIVFVNPDLANA